MPTPVYIICCESGVEDRLTNLASLFNIVERIAVRPAAVQEPGSDTPPPVRFLPSLRIVAVWRAEGEADFGTDFQSEIRMTMLPQRREHCLMSDTFRFLLGTMNHRIVVVIGALDCTDSGQLVVESRIKRPEEDQWLTQKYVIDVVVEPANPANAAPVENDTYDIDGGASVEKTTHQGEDPCGE